VSLIDLTHAVVVAPDGLSGPEARAVTMLVEEVEKRSQVRWPVVTVWPGDGTPAVVVGPDAALAAIAGPHAAALAAEREAPGPEGYRIRVRGTGDTPAVVVAGVDARGVLFGVGRLLRRLRMRQGNVRLPAGLEISTAPQTPLRGHQLGYRPKTNSYDGWTLSMWEQYVRDLVLFGANAIELIPPRSDDDADSPHFPLPPMETMVGMSRIAADYGLDVWIWYPAMDADYGDPATVEAALAEWEDVFRRLPRVDAVFVPGGDPSHTPPGLLMELLARQTERLHRHHPRAGMWVSPQSFDAAWMEEFLRILSEERPGWLDGVVYGPQTRMSLPELRAAVPERYPIRHYPDITHTRQCQYPVRDWDAAFAHTEGREPINPRPRAQATIFHLLNAHTVGFIAYSEGCNDDVNKAVWSALGWDAEADLVEVLREYGRVFIGDEHADAFAQGLLALERNWEGPLLANTGVATTLRQFQALERAASPTLRLNWRFQQALYRAYYDAYLRRRLLYESELQERALDHLREAERTGALPALAAAERVLEQATSEPVGRDLRARVFELAEALFQSVRMQLSVPRYQAIAVGRGANLDTIDLPLNDAPWLLRRFAEIRALSDEEDRRRALQGILDWTNPGPGGFYDELGNPAGRPHLAPGAPYAQDPAFLASPLTGFSRPDAARLSWCRHAETLFDAPLVMRYRGLDPEARYRVRVVYAGDAWGRRVRLVAGDGHEVHPLLEKPRPILPLEFEIPPAAILSGELVLAWHGEPGRGGNGRGCQVAEVWLIRRSEETRE
jgi:hypothetical protein